MLTRLRDAAEDGIVLGVKWGVVAFLVLAGGSYAVSDYALTRAKATQGAAAFSFIQQQIAAQQKPAGVKP